MDISKTLDGIATLVTRSWHYWRTDAAKAERGHWWHDTLYGATIGAKDPRYVYADLHTHVFDTQNVETLVEEVSQRIDVMALVEREAKDSAYHLTFDRFVEKLEAKNVPYEKLGERVVRVQTKNGSLYVIRSIEVYTSGSTNLHGVVIVGNDGHYNDWHERTVSLDEAVSAAERMHTFWFLDHEGSKKSPIIAFRPPKESEVEEDIAVYKNMKERSHGKRPVLETWNLQNSQWMGIANPIAEEYAAALTLAGIANSDAHFNIKEIGLSRTGIPRELMDLSSEDGLLASLNTAITPEHKGELVVDGNYARTRDFVPYMMLTNVPLVGSYVMQRLRQKHALEDLVPHSAIPGQELTSRYASFQKIKERLQQYNSHDSLVVIDIDDCITDSPAKEMAFKQGWKYAPLRTLKWLAWDGPIAAIKDIVAHRSIKAGETQAFAAYRANVVAQLDHLHRLRLSLDSITPLYDGVEGVIQYFRNAERILVSRNIKEIVEATKTALDCAQAYYEQDDKVERILNAAQGKRRVLILGDSKEDAAVIPELRKKGYGVDFIYVQKRYDPNTIHPDATICITRRGYQALYSRLTKTI